MFKVEFPTCYLQKLDSWTTSPVLEVPSWPFSKHGKRDGRFVHEAFAAFFMILVGAQVRFPMPRMCWEGALVLWAWRALGMPRRSPSKATEAHTWPFSKHGKRGEPFVHEGFAAFCTFWWVHLRHATCNSLLAKSWREDGRFSVAGVAVALADAVAAVVAVGVAVLRCRVGLLWAYCGPMVGLWWAYGGPMVSLWWPYLLLAPCCCLLG